MSVAGEFIIKQGDYYLMPDGFWVKDEAAGYSGPYKTSDGTTFTPAGGGGGGGATDIWTEGGIAIDTEGGVAIATEG